MSSGLHQQAIGAGHNGNLNAINIANGQGSGSLNFIYQ